MKSLEKDRTRRYETASSLAKDVERYLKDEPVEACPPSAGYRLRKFVRKHKTPLAAAGVFTLLLLAGIVGSSWQAIRATHAETEANEQRQIALRNERTAKEKEALAHQANHQLRIAREPAEYPLFRSVELAPERLGHEQHGPRSGVARTAASQAGRA